MLMIYQWGQFIIHNLVFSPEFLGVNKFHMPYSSKGDANCHMTCA